MKLISLYIFSTTVLFGLSIFLWLFNAFIIPIFTTSDNDIKWGKSDIQVRILTDSILSYLVEIHRIGYQYEQHSFNFYKYPLYAWGGGIAIRQSLEHRVTWDRKSITEDTSFAWKAAQIKDNLSFAITDSNDFSNQSPTSIKNLIKQRRRWVSGTILDLNILPASYKLFVTARIFT